jgi:2-polyprenyl-3-methyl-5-hydroxy-6-metoxy-1,4-benzoquinol methylase
MNKQIFLKKTNDYIQVAKEAVALNDNITSEKALLEIFQLLIQYTKLKQNYNIENPEHFEKKLYISEVYNEISATCKNIIENFEQQNYLELKTILNSELPYVLTKLANVDFIEEHTADSNTQKCFAYYENNEVGAKNLQVKLERVKNGGPFEWPNIIALNTAVASLINDSKKIVNIGAGTGIFEWVASKNSSALFVASEFDAECVNWCKQNRSRNNIVYCNDTIDALLAKYGKFDLAVSIEVIEHIKDYSKFLTSFSQLADNAIITTPNKARTENDLKAMPPKYYQHVREWTAGEFYWVLKTFYKHVSLYAMPDVYTPEIVPINILSTMTPLIAVCKK